MLNRLVSVIQLGSHCAHILSLGIHEKLLHPVYGDHLGVIIEKQDIISGGFLYPEIVDLGIVKASFFRIGNHLDLRIIL